MLGIYDREIGSCRGLFAGYEAKPLPVGEHWEDVGNNNIVLKPDMAYELGGGNLSAVGIQMLTEDASIFHGDEIFLLGPDLPEITADCAYARVAFLLVDGGGLEQETDLYDTVRRIQYARYRVNPRGFMQRISAASHREPVRVSKSALAEGLDFSKAGSLYIAKCREVKEVRAVKLFYVTEPEFPYEALVALSVTEENITRALDHVLKDFTMDCGSCSLKAVCDEVEGMRELHFHRSSEQNP